MYVLTRGPRLNFSCRSTILHLQTLEKKKFGIWKPCSWYAGGHGVKLASKQLQFCDLSNKSFKAGSYRNFEIGLY